MFKISLALAVTIALGACGGSRFASNNAVGGASNFGGSVALPFARGPIEKACKASDRKARSTARCGCIQAVADQSLSSAQQRRGARYFKDPGKLQEVRQSDRPSDERFWLAWKAYGQSAAAICARS